MTTRIHYETVLAKVHTQSNIARIQTVANYSHNPLRGRGPDNMPLAQKGQSSLFTSYHLRLENAPHT